MTSYPDPEPELPTFELFFKTFGFKRLHGRVWGLLVLSPARSRARRSRPSCRCPRPPPAPPSTSWPSGAPSSPPSTARAAATCTPPSATRSPSSPPCSAAASRWSSSSSRWRPSAPMAFITEKHGERDPRVVTLRSIVTTCDIAEALMQLVLSAVQNAMSDSESVLSRAINAAFKVGVGAPARWLFGGGGPAEAGEDAEDASARSRRGRRRQLETGAGSERRGGAPPMADLPRIVITGVGLTSPGGNDLAEVPAPASWPGARVSGRTRSATWARHARRRVRVRRAALPASQGAAPRDARRQRGHLVRAPGVRGRGSRARALRPGARRRLPRRHRARQRRDRERDPLRVSGSTTSTCASGRTTTTRARWPTTRPARWRSTWA